MEQVNEVKFLYQYADKSVENYLELKPVLEKTKKELRKMFKRKSIKF